MKLGFTGAHIQWVSELLYMYDMKLNIFIIISPLPAMKVEGEKKNGEVEERTWGTYPNRLRNNTK